VPVAGLDLTASKNSDGYTIELGVVTTSLTTISFFIRAEMTSSPIIYAFSSHLEVQVVCGSEIVSVSRS
jgi:hypothetical protein